MTCRTACTAVAMNAIPGAELHALHVAKAQAAVRRGAATFTVRREANGFVRNTWVISVYIYCQGHGKYGVTYIYTHITGTHITFSCIYLGVTYICVDYLMLLLPVTRVWRGM